MVFEMHTGFFLLRYFDVKLRVIIVTIFSNVLASCIRLLDQVFTLFYAELISKQY